MIEPEAAGLLHEEESGGSKDPGMQPLDDRGAGSKDAELRVLQLLENETHIIESNMSQIFRYGVEIHKKYSIPFSCIIFVLLGAPLAIRSGKKGMTMSIGFSILFFYIFLIGGEKLADRRLVLPWLSMWLPNIVLLAAALLLLHNTVREATTINWERVNVLKRFMRRGGS